MPTVRAKGPVSSTLLIVGTGLIAMAALWFLGSLAGLLPMEAAAVAGHSGLRGIASLAVAGCLLAAVGSGER